MLEAKGRALMATGAPKAVVIPTPKLVEDALALAARFRDVEGLQRHVASRGPLVNGAIAALVLLGFACGAGVFIFLAGLGTWLTLPAVLVAPLVALGSLLVLFFVFFSWVEGRALAQALGHRDGGAKPAIPWLPLGLLVFLPLALLLAASPLGGIVMILIAVATPIVYARLDAS
jgi:hypothetical protein